MKKSSRALSNCALRERQVAKLLFDLIDEALKEEDSNGEFYHSIKTACVDIYPSCSRISSARRIFEKTKIEVIKKRISANEFIESAFYALRHAPSALDKFLLRSQIQLRAALVAPVLWKAMSLKPKELPALRGHFTLLLDRINKDKSHGVT